MVGLIDGKMTPQEMSSLEELHQYMMEDEGSWALSDTFLNFVGQLLFYLKCVFLFTGRKTLVGGDIVEVHLYICIHYN